MIRNKLFANIITGTAIVASLATGSMAGIKVFANKNADIEIPEVTTPTPSPSVAPTAQTRVVPTQVPASVSPTPTSSSFPLASVVLGGKFDDDDEIELEHEENSESQENEKIEVPSHKDN